MDIAHLVLEFLRVLIWPSIVVIVALLFRGSIATLLDRFKTVEAEGLGFKFKGTDQTPAEVQQRKAATPQPEATGKGRSARAAEVSFLPTRAEIVEATIEALVESGIRDPNLNLFLGVFRNDTEMVKQAVAAGANVNITDTQVLNMYATTLQEERIQTRTRTLALQKAESRAAAGVAADDA